MQFLMPLLAARIVAALLFPIADCDEVFNFWEPMHYLMYGSGFEPWEYSPQYALRSWLYIWIHRIFFAPLALLDKQAVFFGGRMLLALISSLAEERLWLAVADRFGLRVAHVAMMISMISPGMLAASSAFLPTSFVMGCYMVAFAAWLREDRSQVWIIIAAASVAVVLGWPFAALMMITPALDCIARYSFSLCLLRCWPLGVVVALVTVVDTVMYGRLVCSVWNLVWYNFLGADAEASSTLYGVEQWHYFIRNLLLNFNVALLLALSAPILLVLRLLTDTHDFVVPPATIPADGVPAPNGAAAVGGLRRRRAPSPTILLDGRRDNTEDPPAPPAPAPSWRWVLYMSPLFIWMAFWFFPAHKEERFMSPAYPLIALSAALGMDSLLHFVRPLHRTADATVTFVVLAAFFFISLTRILCLILVYSAPLEVYPAIADHYRASGALRPPDGHPVRVCVGKEWYRFPSHFLLHEDMRAYFLRTGFGGLLPTHFDPPPDGSRTVHHELNRYNKAVWDLASISDVSQCAYVVDMDLPDQSEEHFAADGATWEVIHRAEFLDAGRTPSWARWGLFPFVSERVNTYAPYMALYRRGALGGTSPAPNTTVDPTQSA